MMYIPQHRRVYIEKAIPSEIRSKIKLGEIWFLSYNTSFYYYYYYCLLNHSCLNNFESVLQDQPAYTLIIKECKDKVTQNLIYNLLIKPPSQFPLFWPLTHIPLSSFLLPTHRAYHKANKTWNKTNHLHQICSFTELIIQE